ncbi:hypothetical protein CWB89_10930 [Pseudoalteromonas piscicida]|uniref:ParB/Sulfiredoxin domain-containing protein n=1 Tax=Pseudoalteromonas piscicida TaxID=43662 RepID=A0AAQ2EWY3_PSEO7|nr:MULTISPECIES: ParB N-terminal domain-containing protein [Pseudoalteromonas]TMN38142.1 hypothetical protein CWB94_14805 [Pseudoalteromonas piscicida]TMN41760.1 hypothetical protein CWB95_08300 [Pseudoalteromonas piscicida]TMN47649.1 hypothetical protein CWB91_20635 [Pseudoalteromonas piscicida]TMN56140.1 hypothetical protein CWB92_02990 [Pseudoalteromonas piscicida]TMN59169.1 hypothetical protein CWB93_03890 [Pseudoalteromonas piscicida]
MEVKLIEVANILPHEEVDQAHVTMLEKKIVLDKIWTTPVVIDKNTQVLMDGHHRFEVAKRLRLAKLPCVVMCYERDEIQISCRTSGDSLCYHTVIAAAKSANKFPIKTTRHIFKHSLPVGAFPLSSLYEY